MNYLDELSPPYIREKRIDLSLGADSELPAAMRSVLLDVNYDRTFPEGVVLPLLLEIQGPSPASYQRRVFRRVAPQSILFTPREGGPHAVILREVCHNRWWGSLRFDVSGERLSVGQSGT